MQTYNQSVTQQDKYNLNTKMMRLFTVRNMGMFFKESQFIKMELIKGIKDSFLSSNLVTK